MSTSQVLRKPYDGLQRKLIIAFDIGTTFSGVSYALLIPGEPPVIQGVTQFPGQQKVGGDSKIPSVVCYDQDGNVVAVGSETDVDTNPELSEIEDLVRAEWFKLHLRPSHLAAEQGFNAKTVPPLPLNKTVLDIFGDLLAYMYKSTKQYIKERQGQETLESVGRNIEYVLSHPNGWEGKQQSTMRRAAIRAGLVPNESQATERITFVTEGEASLHFCLNKIPSVLETHANNGILVVDCGGGTIDISAYARSLNKRFREIAPAECLLQGSFFVTERAKAFLTEKLRNSKFGSQDDIDIMTRQFDRTTKPSYNGSSKPTFIRFGRNENDLKLDIRSGSIKIHGTQVGEFFEPAVKSIIKTIEEQLSNTSKPIKAIFMVGGFATSTYLFSKLDDHFKPEGIDILRPDAYLNKAVAEGAVLFKLDRSVSTRIARYTYGTESCIRFDPSDTDHYLREHKSFESLSGDRLLPDWFSAILCKGTQVSEETEFRCTYTSRYTPSTFRALKFESVIIKCYRARNGAFPTWIDLEPEFFPDLCTVAADLSKLKKSIKPQTNYKTGAKYFPVEFDVVLLFGLTELKAQIAWMQNGVEKRGPASIVYDTASMADP